MSYGMRKYNVFLRFNRCYWRTLFAFFFLLVSTLEGWAQSKMVDSVGSEIRYSYADRKKGQNKALKVGLPMPNFKLDNVDNFISETFELSEFKKGGKWLVIDFFTSTCLACFASFPRVDRLQKKFKDSIQFVLIGDNEHRYGRNVESIFNKVAKKQKLELAVAYDSLLFRKWGINSVPFVVIVDDQGVIRAINNGQDMNEDNIRALVRNRNDATSFRNIDYKSWDINFPFLTNGNGGPDTAFLFRSLFSKWRRPTMVYAPITITQYNKEIAPAKGIQGSGVTIEWLFKIAYLDKTIVPFGDSLYGKLWPFPVFEGIDSSRFVVDDKEENNIYNYSLILPKEEATTEAVMRMMQNDLRNYFGFDGIVETREMPYWGLVATEKARKELSTKGDTYYNRSLGASGIEFRNYSVNEILKKVWAYHQMQPPFINETNIDGNIDINIDALMTDFDKVKMELLKKGLELKLKKKNMRVLVIRKSKDRMGKHAALFK